jgi:hypothetical protein
MQPVGATHIRNLDENGANVTAGRATVGKIYAANTSGAAAFVQIFDRAVADVVLGTTVPRYVFPLAATTGHFELNFDYPGEFFETRLSAFSTTTAEGNTGSADGVFLQAWVW